MDSGYYAYDPASPKGRRERPRALRCIPHEVRPNFLVGAPWPRQLSRRGRHKQLWVSDDSFFSNKKHYICWVCIWIRNFMERYNSAFNFLRKILFFFFFRTVWYYYGLIQCFENKIFGKCLGSLVEGKIVLCLQCDGIIFYANIISEKIIKMTQIYCDSHINVFSHLILAESYTTFKQDENWIIRSEGLQKIHRSFISWIFLTR